MSCNEVTITRFRNKQPSRESSTRRQSLKPLQLVLCNTSGSILVEIAALLLVKEIPLTFDVPVDLPLRV